VESFSPVILRRAAIAIPAVLSLGALTAPEACALPDAQVALTSPAEQGFREGDVVPLTAEIRSTGDRALPPIPVVLFADGGPYAEWRLPQELARGESTTWELSWTGRRGAHRFLVTADPFNDIRESDETNNTASLDVQVAEAPRPFPWRALAGGSLAFLLGLAAGRFLRRLGRARRASSRPPQVEPDEPAAD
jgi:hypothetical protein